MPYDSNSPVEYTNCQEYEVRNGGREWWYCTRPAGHEGAHVFPLPSSATTRGNQNG